MMKFNPLFAVIFAAAMLALPFASASSLSFISPSHQDGCQCDPQQFMLSLNADAEQGEVYTLTIATQGDTFTTFVTPSIDAEPHSQSPVIAFMTPHCDALPGVYWFKVSATGSRGTMLTATGSSTVEECHYLKLQFTPEQQVCAGEQARFDITLENAGMFPEAGSVFTDLDPRLYSLANSSFALSPGQTKQYNLYVNTPNSMPPGKLPFHVNASSFYTYRDTYALLNVLDCSGLKISVPPACINVNPDETVTQQATLTNTGIDDTFDVTLLCPAFVTTTVSSVTLASGQSATVPLIIRASHSDLNKDYLCTVRAVSRRYGREFTNSTSICVRQLYGAELETELAGDAITACQGDAATIPMRIRNTGKAATYSLSTSLGSLSKSSVSLAVGGQDSFSVYAPGTLAVGSYTVQVTASNQYYAATKSARLTVEKCFDSALSISNGQLEMCPGEAFSTTATIYNKGTRADDFALTLASPDFLQASVSPAQLSVSALSSKEFRVSVAALYTAQDNQQASVQVTARDGSTSTATIGVRILPLNVCHNVALTPDGLKEVEVCQGNTFDLLLTNKGRFTEVLDLTVEGPEWAFVTPPKVSLAPGESKHAYVFFSPPFNTRPGDYTITFHGSNDKVAVQATLTARVYPVGGLGQQIPNYTTTDYVLDFAVPTSAQFEENASKPLSFTVTNKGIAPLTDVTLYFENDDLRVLNETIEPFTLEPGEQRAVTIEVEPVRSAGVYPTLFRAVAREKFVERAETITVKPRSWTLKKLYQDYYVEGNVSRTVAHLNVTNTGAFQIELSPSLFGTSENYSFDPSPVRLQPGESRDVKLYTNAPTESNATVALVTKGGDYTYYDAVTLQPEPLGATGLFASAATFGALLLAILIAAGVLFYVTRKPRETEAAESAKKRGAKVKKRGRNKRR